MNRAALFFDIDGTVLSEITKEIPASTVDALKGHTTQDIFYLSIQEEHTAVFRWN